MLTTGKNSTKHCTKCARRKPLADFRPYSGRSRDGRRPLCSECQRKYEARWRSRNRDRLAQKRRERKDREAEYRRKYNRERRGWILLTECGRRARKQGLEFDLDRHAEEIENRVQAGRCEMTGLELCLDNGRAKWNSPSIHRMDPAEGYTLSNIKIVCWAMNAALGSWGEEVLRQVVESWSRRRT